MSLIILSNCIKGTAYCGLKRDVIDYAEEYGVDLDILMFAKAHPTIVPYINADKDMIHSIAETGWGRSLVGDGNSYIKLSVKADSTDYEVYMDCAVKQKKSGTPLFITASTQSDANHASNIYTSGGSTYNIWVAGLGSAGSFTPVIGNRYKHNVKVSGGRVVWTEETIGTILNSSYSGTPVSNTEYYLYTHIGNLRGRCSYVAGFEGYIKKGGLIVSHFLPCKNPNGTDYGMVDIVSGQFYGNANTQGSFSVELTENA